MSPKLICQNCRWAIGISKTSRQCFINKKVNVPETECPIIDILKKTLEDELRKVADCE